MCKVELILVVSVFLQAKLAKGTLPDLILDVKWRGEVHRLSLKAALTFFAELMTEFFQTLANWVWKMLPRCLGDLFCPGSKKCSYEVRACSTVNPSFHVCTD